MTARLDSANTRLRVYSFKEGLLSRVAHDLEIEAPLVTGTVDGDLLRVTVDARGLKVLHAMRDGRPDPGALSAKDRAEIEASLARDVLDVAHHPSIVFTADLRQRTAAALPGRLSLRGVERPVELSLTEVGGRIRGEAWVDQEAFGIPPFKALMGALKVKAAVRVVAEVDASLLGP